MGPELLTSAPADAVESWSKPEASTGAAAETDDGTNSEFAPSNAETPPDVESWKAELAGEAADDATGATDRFSGSEAMTGAGANGNHEERPATLPAGEDESGTFRPERAEADEFGVIVTDTEPAGLASATGWVRGDGGNACPESHPIKGNATSRIYHRPGESSYDATIPELCFATEEDAAAAGYRPRAR